LRRPEVAERLRTACSRVMSRYLMPAETGGFKYVETFLFQAGLPLCHCNRFADFIRQVERHYGLPADSGSLDSGEELRDHLLTYSGMQGIPLLKRSLRGPAGPLICQAALRVVLEAE